MDDDEFDTVANAYVMDPGPENHAECAAWLKAQFARLGCGVVVSLAPPLVATPYEVTPFACPHDVVFWHAPTSEQIAEWARDGVA